MFLKPVSFEWVVKGYSLMATYNEFCLRYGYDINSNEAKKYYELHQINLNAFEKVANNSKDIKTINRGVFQQNYDKVFTK